MTNSQSNRRLAVSAAFIVVSLVAGLGGCAGRFDQVGLDNATSLKTRSLATLEKANTPFTEHKAEAEALRTELTKAYEHAKTQSKNDDAAKQWDVLIKPDGNLLGAALKKWEDEGTIKPALLSALSHEISQGFDQIIELESKKPGKK